LSLDALHKAVYQLDGKTDIISVPVNDSSQRKTSHNLSEVFNICLMQRATPLYRILMAVPSTTDVLQLCQPSLSSLLSFSLEGIKTPQPLRRFYATTAAGQLPRQSPKRLVVSLLFSPSDVAVGSPLLAAVGNNHRRSGMESVFTDLILASYF
jgi:hypothetical protein